VTATSDLIAAVLGTHSRELVATYFDPRSRFAGSTFDALPPIEPNGLTPSDLLATGLLDVPFGPRAVRVLLEDEREALEQQLARIPHDVDLWDATDEQLAPAYDLWRDLKTSLKGMGVGPTRRSKLMARKRPRLVPVVDATIRTALGIGPDDDSWLVFRQALRDDGGALVRRIENLRPAHVRREDVSTLRILDAALWMNLSNAKHVAPLREAARAKTAPPPAATRGSMPPSDRAHSLPS
jgi:hypothetical protein